jgi:hypothetical protein
MASEGRSPGLSSAWAIVAVRWILGVQCLLSGLNWWFKILPFPNIAEPVVGPMKHQIVATMIETGWMFSAAKLIEIGIGVALLTDRFAVLMLVVAFPILLMTFVLDLIPFGAAIAGAVAGEVTNRNLWAAFLDMIFFGGAVFLMQVYLMLEYFDDYRRLFVVRPGDATAPRIFDHSCPATRCAIRWGAIVIGGASTLWMLAMVGQWLVPWSSLAILAPLR